MRLAAVMLCCLMPLAGTAIGDENGPHVTAAWRGMETAMLRIETPGEPPRCVPVKVADEPDERRRGMQYLAASRVRAWPVWFVFPEPTETSWHMMGVRAPLDIAWVDAGGTVMAVARMTPGTTGYAADGAIRYALELAAGQAAALGIRPGTRLVRIPASHEP